MIYRQLLTNIYQNEYHTTYNKNKASFTFTVRDALKFIFSNFLYFLIIDES